MAGIEKLRTKRAPDPWARLRQFTPARIGLGRVGGSVPTQALLDFELAHSRARDAVHAAFDAEALARELRESGFGTPLIVSSQARDRKEYLLRPDLGRRLDGESRERIRGAGIEAQYQGHGGTGTGPLKPKEGLNGAPKVGGALSVVIADGLSAVAPVRHAVPLLRELRSMPGMGWTNVIVTVANHARVALGDETGELLGAEGVVVLIGERPGLSSPDSLGVYLTWAPRVGRTDAERNCISNVRPEGLPYAEAARRLVYLLSEARRLRLSGVGLKDDSEARESLP